jgi:ankyrin repeat protein
MHEMVWIRKPGVGSNAPSRPGSGKMKSLEFIRLLVKHEATVDMRMKHNARGTRSYLNTTGATPFLLAACTADAELMTLLHELGADPKLTNNEGTTALMMAAGVGVRSPTEDAGTEEAAREAVLLALKLGNDINAKDTRGETAMHGAAYKHFPSMPQLLVENGADIKTWNTKNKNGWTPLRIATGVERTANFRFCLKTAAAIKAIMEAAGVSTEL